MAGRRQPVAVLEANGRKHLTEAEKDARRDAELRVPPAEKIKPPKWLPKELRREFRTLGEQLRAVGLYTDLDADTLGRYLIAHREWLAATSEVQAALNAMPREVEAVDAWGKVQERYFKQARNCANDMGLTVTSRCRLVLPAALPAAAFQSDEGADEFTQALLARQQRAEGM